jgi:hypothetical protein
MSIYNFTVNDYHQNAFTGKQRARLDTEIEIFSNQINCTHTFYTKILTKPFKNLKTENYLDSSDALTFTKINKQISNIKSMETRYLFILSFGDMCMIILPLLLYFIYSIYIVVCDEWAPVVNPFYFLFFGVLFAAFFTLNSLTKTLVIIFDDEEKINIPYGGMLNLNFRKNRKNIEIVKRELKNILTLSY